MNSEIIIKVGQTWRWKVVNTEFVIISNVIYNNKSGLTTVWFTDGDFEFKDVFLRQYELIRED